MHDPFGMPFSPGGFGVDGVGKTGDGADEEAPHLLVETGIFQSHCHLGGDFSMAKASSLTNRPPWVSPSSSTPLVISLLTRGMASSDSIPP